MKPNLSAILVMMAIVQSARVQEECTFYKYCDRSGLCRGFETFNQLDIKPCMANTSQVNKYFKYIRNNTIRIILVPSGEHAILNTSLDLRDLQAIAYENSRKRYTVSLNIFNLNGIDMNTDFQLHNYLNFQLELFQISYSNLEFYSSGRQIHCHDENISRFANSIAGKLTTYMAFKNVKFPKQMCPQMFQNVTLNRISFTKHYPKFHSVSLNQSLSIQIKELELLNLETIKFVVDSKILDSHVYGKLQSLRIIGSPLYKIQPPELFKDYQYLNRVTLVINNLKGFLHNMGGLDWTKHLNHHLFTTQHVVDYKIGMKLTKQERDLVVENIRLVYLFNFASRDSDKQSLISSYFPSIYYDFPDEDICLYATYPHEYLIVTLLEHFSLSLNASCSMALLYEYVWLFYKPNGIKFGSNLPIIDQEIFDRVYADCNMTQRLNNCYVVNSTEYHDPYFDSYDVNVALDNTKAILLDIIGPFVSAVGLSSNLLIILTIVHNKRKYKNNKIAALKSKSDPQGRQLLVLLDETMYKYMLINSVVNAIYCLLYLIDLTAECSAGVINDLPVRYYNSFKGIECVVKDCIVLLLSSTLKLLSNILIIQISLNRYLLLGKEHPKILIKVSEFKVKYVVAISLLVSILLSVIVVFQELFFTHFKHLTVIDYLYTDSSVVNLNASERILTYNYYGDYQSSIYLGAFNFKRLTDKLSELTLLLTFTIIHDMVAYFLFCLVSLIMDIMTLKMLKQVIEDHSKISKVTKEDEKYQKAETKTFWMVLSLNLANFILRLPDLLSSALLIFTSQNPSLFIVLCLRFNKCLTFSDLSNISYIFSLALNLLFYLAFNKNFQHSFEELMNKFRIKTCLKPKCAAEQTVTRSSSLQPSI